MNRKHHQTHKLNRRSFIQTAATLPFIGSAFQQSLDAADSDMNIRRIEIFPARYPMTGHFKFFTGPPWFPGESGHFRKNDH